MKKVLSVSACVDQLKQALASEFRTQWIEGEVVSFSRSPAGHWYFTLKDNKAALSCVFFKYDVLGFKDVKKFQEGSTVRVWGKIDIYAARGSLQIVVKKIVVGGTGNLLEQFEQLKRSLAMEGLFDPEIKLQIPKLPQRVGVITAPDSAALADFINVFKRRSFYMDIIIFPSLVQGEKAAGELRRALEQAIRCGMEGNLDVIVLTRGGGASEDLWCFNDEGLAWDIFNSPIPIISAVGHQVDYTIADFVADHRCETPTAAAQFLTEYQVQLRERVPNLGKQLKSSMTRKVDHLQHRLLRRSPQNIINKLYKKSRTQQDRVRSLQRRLLSGDILSIQNKNYRIDDLFQRLFLTIRDKVQHHEILLKQQRQLLEAFAPHNILRRGFCYITNNQQNIVKTASEFKKLDENDIFELVFSDGKIKQRKRVV